MPLPVPDLRPTLDRLTSHPGRAPCSDAERRAMLEVHDDLRARGHEAWVQTYWVRPQWAGSLTVHAALGVAASLLATSLPAVAFGVAAFALLSYGLELAGRGGLLRLLFVRRATQVVLVDPPDPGRIHLMICASADAPRRGMVFRERLRRLGARLQRLTRGHAPSALAWVLIALAWVAAAAAARTAGAEGPVLGTLQFLPTVVLLLAVTAGLDVVLSAVSPGAGEAGAVAVAVALHEELTARPPERLSAGLLVAGAGEGFPYAVAQHLRRERPDRTNTVVLEIGPCAGGTPAYSRRLGALLALPVHPQLRIAGDAAGLRPEALRRPGAAVAAQRRSVPAVHVRCVGEDGILPRHRTPDDVAEAVEPATLAAALQACVSMVDALDAELAVVD